MATGEVAALPAGFKLDAAPTGDAGLPAGFTLDAAAPPTPAPAAPTPAAPARTGRGGVNRDDGSFITGNLNKGIANAAGLPVDTAANIIDLITAGVGTMHGGAVREGMRQPPALTDRANVPLSGEWIQNMMRKGGSITPAAEPESSIGNYGAHMLQALPMAAMGGRPGMPARPAMPPPMTPASAPPMPRPPAPNPFQAVRNALPNPQVQLPSAAQAPRALTAAASSGAAGQLGADIGGEEWRGPASMAPGARSMQTKAPGQRATEQRKAEAFGTARDMGIPVPPRLLKEDRPQQTAQNVVNRHLGQPEGTEVSLDTLRQFRGAHLADYQAPFQSAALARGLQPDQQFQNRIQALGDEIAGGTATLPQTFRGVREATRLLQEYGYGQMPPGVAGGNLPPRGVIPTANAQRAIRIMREGATANFQTGGENNVALARAQRGIANALEDLVETNLQRTNQGDLMQQFRAARTAMARSHDVEGAMDAKTNRVDSTKLAQMVNEGRPITGELQEYGQLASTFPQAVQSPPNTQASNEKFTRRSSPMAITHPAAVGLHMATGWMDPLTKSRPYQSMIDPRRRLSPEQEQQIRYFLAAQAANQRQGDIPPPPR